MQLCAYTWFDGLRIASICVYHAVLSREVGEGVPVFPEADAVDTSLLCRLNTHCGVNLYATASMRG